MTSTSITSWFHELQQGDEEAAVKLWETFFTRLQRVAKKQIPQLAAFDEEDVAASAFGAFFQSMVRGDFPDIANREHLWFLLVRITVRKARDKLRHEGAQRRGGGRKSTAVVRLTEDAMPLDELPATVPDPGFSSLMADQCRHLLSKLGDTELEQVALRKLDGFTNDEVAERLGYSRRTIQRMLNVIRKCWEAELSDPPT